ncbi:MAG: hypothetical protein JW943_07485 [Deltaproteobacteria bacterium]|nr:hypothetical protein [Deltaproteobacteria bacterium]
MKKIVLFLLMMAFIPNLAGATEAYDFMTAIIKSFQSSEIAGSRIKNSESSDVVSLMKDIIVFNNEMRTAAEFTKPYLNSKNEIIKKSAESFFTIYSSIVQNNENLLNTFENAFNKPEDTASKEGTFLRKLSENMAANEELWRMLLYATTMSAYCLVDSTRTEDGKLKFLTITTEEKKALIDQLVGVFGDGIKGGPKGGQLPLEWSGALLYSFFTKGWKPLDSK